MKAKIKTTGEVVNITDYHISYSRVSFYCKESDGKNTWYDCDELDIIKEVENSIDWEQRRFELIKAAFPAVIPLVSGESMEEILSFSAEASIKYADEVIKKLKET